MATAIPAVDDHAGVASVIRLSVCEHNNLILD